MPPAWRGAASTRPDFNATIFTRRRTRDRTTRSTSGSRERLLAPPSPTAPVLAVYAEHNAQGTNIERRCPQRLEGSRFRPHRFQRHYLSRTATRDQKTRSTSGSRERLLAPPSPQRPSWLQKMLAKSR